jgi:hypothetical protein
MQELLRVNLATQMAVYKEIRADREDLVKQLRGGQPVNIDGYEIALPLYEQMIASRPAGEGTTPFPGPTLIAQVDRSETATISRDVKALASRLPGASVQLVVEEPFWKEIDRFYDSAPNLSAATLAWLSQQ